MARNFKASMNKNWDLHSDNKTKITTNSSCQRRRRLGISNGCASKSSKSKKMKIKIK